VTPGLTTAAQGWALAGRASEGAGRVRATFARGEGREVAITYELGARRATLDAGGGRVVALSLSTDPAGAIDPASWTCSCPAAGVAACLHVALAARGLAEEAEHDEGGGVDLGEDAPDPRYAADLELSPGLAAAAARSDAAIERIEGGGLRVLAATVTPAAGGGLACDCPMRDAPACLHRALAAAWGRGERHAHADAAAPRATPAAPAGGAAAAAAAGAPAARAGEELPAEDVDRFRPTLDRVEALVAELVSFGLQRATPATLERVDALVIAARALGVRDGAPRHAGLGRIARGLERLRQILGEFQARLVTTTELDVLGELAVLRNLARAVRANTGALPLADFAGATQQEYLEVPAIDAQGLGFEAWTTPAGFAGVTAFVADLRSGRVLTRTNTLPADLAADFASRGWSSNSWADQLAAQPAFAGASVTYLDLARNRFLLSGAMVAPDSGRLSGSGKTQLGKRPPIPLDDPKLRPSTILGAADAVRIASRLGFDPLGRPPSSPPVAILPVRSISASRFDRASQRLSLAVETDRGARVGCALTYRDDRALWIDNLERLARAVTPPRALFVRLRLDGGALVIEPLTAYFEKGPPRHLTYKPLDVEVKRPATTPGEEVKG
jgi:hypothetical protein